MRIAIHHREGSFSERWIQYCTENNIEFKIVDCFDSDIITQLKDVDALMWHHHHAVYKDVLLAKNLLFSLEQAGVKVFPDFNTGWHFDDKVAQKYLLESINAPLVKSHVFYSKKDAEKWVNTTTFPKVFKLKGGAGAANVSLVHNKRQAKKKINKAFGKGFSQFDKFGHVRDQYAKFVNGNGTILSVFKSLIRLFISTDFSKMSGLEKGYIYFQDFVSNNDSDIRVIVIKDKAFAIKRMTRGNDFRASGSGVIKYDKDEIDIRCVKLAFDLNKKINSQCIAYDFVFDSNNQPLLIETSYGFGIDAYNACPGYWDQDLKWHNGKFNPQEWMVEELISSMKY